MKNKPSRHRPIASEVRKDLKQPRRSALPQWHTWVRKKQKPSSSGTEEFRIVDLFSGCGGMTLGAVVAAQSCGLRPRVKLAADINQDAAITYKKNFASLIDRFHDGDIGQLFPEVFKPAGSIERSLRQIDLVVAGPPCQGHSNLNNSTRRDDPRNRLYLNAITAIEKIKPKLALVENVPSVVHDKNVVTYDARSRLESIGYYVEEVVVRRLNIWFSSTQKAPLARCQLESLQAD
ncbi:MAG: DNA cytosine methyltransferase [Rhodocyclaceae bacterium]